MMSLIHWFSAERRLEACERTIIALGGSRHSDEGIPVQLSAQRDMIKHEIEYYKEQSRLFGVILFGLFMLGLLVLPFLKFKGVF